MVNEIYAPLSLEDEEKAIKRLKEVATLFHKRGRVPSLILQESGLKELMDSGKFEIGTCTRDDLEKLDLDELNACLLMLRKEQVIREEYCAFYSIHNIPVVKLTENDDWNGKDYLKDIQWSMKSHYPALNDLITHFRQQDTDFTNVHSLGIHVDPDFTYGAYLNGDSKVALVPFSSTRRVDYPIVNYDFEGYGDMSSPAIAASEIGLGINKLKNAFEHISGNELKTLAISMPTTLPSAFNKYFESDLEVQIYEEVALEKNDAYEIIRKGAALAGIDQVEIYPKVRCIVSAYENVGKSYCLKEKEWALVYDWNEKNIAVSLVQCEHGKLWISWQEIMDNPLRNMDYPLVDIKRHMEPYYKKSEKMIKEMLQRLQIEHYDIAKVYLAGRWVNYSFVVQWLEDFMGPGVKICSQIGMEYAATKGAAYLAGKIKIN